MEKPAISTRISELISALETSQNAFATAINTSSSRISNVTTGRNKPDFDLIQAILSKFTIVSSDWLILGAGPMFKSEVLQAQEDAAPYQVQRRNGQSQAQAFQPDRQAGTADIHIVVENPGGHPVVCVINERAAAGWARGFADHAFYEQLPKFALPDFLDPRGEYFAIEVTGDSMYPTVADRDLVITRRIFDSFDIHQGGVYVLLTGDGIQIKRVERIGFNQLRLLSDNTRYHAQIVQAEVCKAIFKVEYRLTTQLTNPNEELYSILQNLQLRLKEVEVKIQ